MDVYRKQNVTPIQGKYVHHANHAHYACICKLIMKIYEIGSLRDPSVPLVISKVRTSGSFHQMPLQLTPKLRHPI